MRSTTIGSVCSVIMGQAPLGASYNSLGLGVPLLAGASDLGIDFPEAHRFTSKPTQLSRDGDIILCVRATIGVLNWSDRVYCLGRGVAALRPDSTCLDSRYLWHWLLGKRQMLESHAKGSTFKQITRSAIESLPIDLPSLPEQRRIASLLDRADAVRRKREESRRLVDELLRSEFLEMFGDPVRNEKGWEVVKLGEIANVQGGLQVTSRRDSLPLQVPYLRVANVHRGRLDLTELKMIGTTQQELARTRLQAGDLLVVEGHGNADELGRCSVWEGAVEICTHQNHLIRVRPDMDRVTSTFLEAFLNSAGGRRQLAKAGKTTSGLNTISTRQVGSLQIPVPPLDLQHRYVERVAVVRVASEALVGHQTTLALLQESLQSQLLQEAS